MRQYHSHAIHRRCAAGQFRAPRHAYGSRAARLHTLESHSPLRSSGSNLANAYRDGVLPPNVTARVAVEQASTFGWERYVGTSGQVVGMNTFGASAPLKELQRKFGFEPDCVIAAVKQQLGRK